MLAIRSLRLTRELTQSDVASRVRIGRSYLSKIERGAYNPPARLRKQLAAFFGIGAEHLLSEVEVQHDFPR